MKKVIYIGIAVVALGLTSCSKEDIQPNSTSDTFTPEFKSLDTDVTDPELSGSDGSGGVTDPELSGTDIGTTGN